MPRSDSSPRPLVLDGGTGAALARRGVRSPVAWSGLAVVEAPDLLGRVHDSWLAAGADVLTTNTFSAARFVLESAGCDDVSAVQEATIRAAVAAARRAERETLLAGSLSNFPPAFSVERYPHPRAENDSYRELAERLAESVDVLILEMIEDVEHSARLYEAARSTGLPLWVGVSARRTGHRLHPYDFPDQVLGPILEQVRSWQPDLIAVMHTPLQDVRAVVEALGQVGSLGAYPEIGAESPEEVVRFFERLVRQESTVRVVGGCCGSTAEHVAALRNWIDRGD